MNIDPSGTFLYAANQNNDAIALFGIQPSNGKLKLSALATTPTPVDVEFGPLAFSAANSSCGIAGRGDGPPCGSCTQQAYCARAARNPPRKNQKASGALSVL